MKVNPGLSLTELSTIQAYDEMSEEWVMAHSTPEFWQWGFDLFRLFLPEGHILEVGCGGGRDARTLVEMGYRWTGTDPSSAMVRYIRQQTSPPGEVHQCAAYDVGRLPGRPFDGFWASAVLLHIPHARAREALVAIHEALRPGGVGFISVKKGVGAEALAMDAKEKKSNTLPPRFFYYYEDGQLDQALVSAGFGVLACEVFTPGTRTDWFMYIVERLP